MTIKGRSCADGQKHRKKSQNKDATSPTVALELVLIISAIDVNKRMYVDVVNIPVSFVISDMDKYVIMVM